MQEQCTAEMVDVVAAEAERTLRTLPVACASISVWERERGLLRTLVNAGVLAPGEAGAPITPGSEVWGALWVATLPGARPLTRDDLPRVVRAANEIARALTGLGAGA